MTEFEMKMKAAQKAVGLGKLSRRDFIQFALASGMTVAAANALFATAARAEPKKGGVFKAAVGHGQTTDSLDPATWSNGFTFAWGKSVMGAPLVQISQKNEIIPHVAESLEPTDGAKKWVVKLRKGITFHNGKPLTADDVVATFEMLRQNGEGKKDLFLATDVDAGYLIRHGRAREEHREAMVVAPAQVDAFGPEHEALPANRAEVSEAGGNAETARRAPRQRRVRQAVMTAGEGPPQALDDVSAQPASGG